MALVWRFQRATCVPGYWAATMGNRRLAAIYATMARRMLGDDIPALELETDGIWNRIRRIMVGQR